jgi:hypothetical protein
MLLALALCMAAPADDWWATVVVPDMPPVPRLTLPLAVCPAATLVVLCFEPTWQPTEPAPLPLLLLLLAVVAPAVVVVDDPVVDFVPA